MPDKPQKTTQAKPPKLVKIKDISELLGVSDPFVRRLVKSGKIPCYSFGRNCIRYDPAKVLAALGVNK